MAKKVIPLIIAGGKGCRFWPLSRENCPKQFLSLDGGAPLLRRCFIRAKGLENAAVPCVVAGEDQKALVESALNGEVYRFFGEPAAKNTAAAVYYGCRSLQEEAEDSIVVVLPADHQITNDEGFIKTIRRAVAVAEEKKSLVVVGIPPRYPATGYGYAERSKKEYLEHDAYYKVRRFVEKPHREKARRYIKKGTYCWNSGILVFPLSELFAVYERHLPKYNAAFGEKMPMEHLALAQIYAELESVSFDVGILEKEKRVYLVDADFGWDDVGSYNSLGALIDADEAGNIRRGNQWLKDVRGSVVLTDNLLTAVIGVKDLVIVEDHGVLLICPRGRVEEIRAVVRGLEKKDCQYR